ncbi:MAG: hypothetical protein AUJ98_10285 [Bacteroidetes bacterium CG2_30_33_31]|nr:MAG: hypothetical protein AUJ98_10285 [Bacteroidetes bacterium CG2_30_33_31]
MGPLFSQGIIGEELNMFIGFLIGILFGFGLESGGFANTRKLAGVFYGYDFVVLKVFFTAALTAAIGLFLLDRYQIMDINLTFYPKTFWLPTLIGGLIMAFGFIIGGFCPGTSLCAASTGKIDGMVFVGGVFLGIIGYAFTSATLWEGLKNKGALGKVDIATALGLSDGLFILLVTIVAVIAFVVVTKIEAHMKAKHDYQL